jgi:hypothetical protein
MKAIQAPVINIQNHQKDYTAWTSYDKNNFLLLFIDILFLDRV